MSFVWLALTAATVAVLTGAVILPRLRRSMMDFPSWRSSHTTATPRGGGIAVSGAIVAVGGFALWVLHLGPLAAVSIGVVLCASILGWLEDSRGLSVAARIGGQMLIGGVAGLAIVGLVEAPLWAMLLLAVASVLFINAANFMDGVNGISSAHGILLGLFAVIMDVQFKVAHVGTLGAVMAGAFAGFLPWNMPRARMFLGDVGSYALGASQLVVVSWLVLAGLSPVIAVAPAVPYLFDVTSTLLRRASRREPLTEAHHEHLYQLIHERRGSHEAAAAVAAGATTLTCAIGLFACLFDWSPVLVVVMYGIVVTSYYRLSIPAVILQDRATAGNDRGQRA